MGEQQNWKMGELAALFCCGVVYGLQQREPQMHYFRRVAGYALGMPGMLLWWTQVDALGKKDPPRLSLKQTAAWCVACVL
jgi:hypothetical protein